MKRLSQHTETLLLENDCVVLPGFGAFMARTVPAVYKEDEHLFFPPTRRVVFNSLLTHDDGLLTARYMDAHGFSAADAAHAVALSIDRLRDTLAIDGAATLPGLGVMRQDITGALTFVPSTEGMTAPALFGLDAIEVAPLRVLEAQRPTISVSDSKAEEPQKVITSTERTIDIHIGRSALRRIASVAAVALILVLFALPTVDTSRTDIASLGITPIPTLSETIVEDEPEAEAVLANPMTEESAVDAEPATSEITTGTTPTETVSEAPTTEAAPVESVSEVSEAPAAPVVTTPARRYHVIISSLPSKRGVDEAVQKYRDKGFADATAVEGDGRFRISLKAFDDKAEGEAYVTELRKNEAYQHAWLLSVKAR